MKKKIKVYCSQISKGKTDLVKGVTYYFNVHFIQILFRDAVLKESGLTDRGESH